MTERRLYPSRALHGQVAHQIGRRIVSGDIAEGAYLPRESELSEEFEVSRQAVREALKVLAAKGLVSTRRRAGTVVLPRSEWNLLDPDVIAWHPTTQLTPKFIRDLLQLRCIIEPEAARLAATHGDSAATARIRAALDRMLATAEASDLDAFVQADSEFHLAIFAASGNDLIERLGTVLRPLMEAAFPLHAIGDDTLIVSVGHHRPVFDAIAARAPVKARTAMQEFLGRVGADLNRASGPAAAKP